MAFFCLGVNIKAQEVLISYRFQFNWFFVKPGLSEGCYCFGLHKGWSCDDESVVHVSLHVDVVLVIVEPCTVFSLPFEFPVQDNNVA